MFCTGGIRCEKSTNYLIGQGVDAVYHLRGGILKYLEEVPETESRWQGGCFVFDDRVSVTHGLQEGPHVLCHACRRPLLPRIAHVRSMKRACPAITASTRPARTTRPAFASDSARSRLPAHGVCSIWGLTNRGPGLGPVHGFVP